MKKITITIEARSLFDTHKCIVSPSVAVNPPAIQYFKGIDKSFPSGNITDNRLKQISEFIIQMLSSKEYPNPPVCSKLKSEMIAKKYVKVLLHNLRYCKKSTRSLYA